MRITLLTISCNVITCRLPRIVLSHEAPSYGKTHSATEKQSVSHYERRGCRRGGGLWVEGRARVSGSVHVSQVVLEASLCRVGRWRVS
jgi:hypothetical protein